MRDIDQATVIVVTLFAVVLVIAWTVVIGGLGT